MNIAVAEDVTVTTKKSSRVSIISIAANFSLCILKLLAGVFGHSAALISDAAHSASDMVGSGIILIGIRIAGRRPDRNYPYGYERIENVTAMLLAFILFGTALGIGTSAAGRIIDGSYRSSRMPGLITLVVALIAIAAKEGLFWYMKITGRKLRSSALQADAWHQRSDAISSVGSLIGIFGARMGFAILDPLASLLICLFVFHAAWEIFHDAVAKIADKALDEARADEIKAFITAQPEVVQVTDFRSRNFGNKAYVEFCIHADHRLTFPEVYQLKQTVAAAVEQEFTEIKQCLIGLCPTAQ